jgi:hypothetical protein
VAHNSCGLIAEFPQICRDFENSDKASTAALSLDLRRKQPGGGRVPRNDENFSRPADEDYTDDANWGE